MLRKIYWIMVCGVVVGQGGLACSEQPSEMAPEPEPEPTICQGKSFAGVELAGIWHFNVVYGPAVQLTEAVRFDKQEDQYVATLFYRRASSVRFDASGVEVVVETEVDEGQPVPVTTLRLCDMAEDGTVTGIYKYCIADECVPAEVIGHKVEPLDEPVSAGITLIAAYNGPEDGDWRYYGYTSSNVRVHKGMAYLARRYDGLRIVDVGDPAAPRERGHAPVADPDNEDYNDVKVIEGPDGRVYAYMASSVRGVVVVDVTNPDEPVEVTTFPEPSQIPDGVPSVHTIFIEGDRAYATQDADPAALLIYDVSNPARPRALASWTRGGYLHDLYVDKGRAYINYWDAGLVILDTLSDPQNPTVVGEFKDYGDTTSHSNWVTRVAGRTISVHGDDEYGAHVRIVDVDDTSAEFLDEIGRYQTRPEVSVHNIMAHEDKAFVTYYQDGLRVLDLKDPEHPREIAHYNTWPGAEPGYGEVFSEGASGVDFDPDTGLIYVADTHRGLFVLRLE